jgi:hypothetical protein
MTKEQWRNLNLDDLIITSYDEHIYKVVSIGWEDMDESEYQDDNDYIVECIDLFDKFKGKGNSIFRIYQIESLDKRLPDEIIKIANQCDSPYDFLKGYFIQNNN